MRTHFSNPTRILSCAIPFLAALAVTCGAASAADPAFPYKVTVIKDLPGGAEFAMARGVNTAGQVTGFGTVAAASGGTHAWVWSAATGTVDLGSLPDNTNRSETFDINDSKQAVGQVGMSAFIWSKTTGIQKLFVAPPGLLDSSAAHGVNDGGEVVGQLTSSSNTAIGHAFLWTKSQGLQDLGDLSGGSENSDARAINNFGNVVGVGSDPGGQHAFIWTKSGGMVSLGQLPDALFDSGSEARDINNTNQVVGIGAGPTGTQHGFIWSKTTGMKDLGVIPGADSAGPGSNYSRANSINDKGAAVGQAAGLSNFRVAVLWEPGKDPVDLNTLIDPSSGIILSEATAIDDAGHIVGWGETKGADGSRHDPALLPDSRKLPDGFALRPVGRAIFNGLNIPVL